MAISAAALTAASVASAQISDTIGRGLGGDGSLSIAAGDSDRVVPASDYAALTAMAGAGATSLTVDDASGFSAGNAIVVVQTQIPTDVADMVPDSDPVELDTLALGHFELVRITGVATNTITLETPLAGSFVAPGAQVIRLREYTNVSIAAGRSLTPRPWDGQRGGVVAFVATGTVTVSGAVQADHAGFRGGASSDSNCTLGCSSPAREVCSGGEGTGRVGEGLEHNTMDATPADDEYGDEACGIGNRDLGGGGGGNPRAGGGGGGNGGVGGEGGADDTLGGSPGFGGGAVSMIFPSRISFGGGGGGGQTTVPLSGTAGDGEVGGGAIFIHARQVTVLSGGRISADGRDAADVATLVGGQAQGGGGGGAGGMVLVVAGDAIDCVGAEVRSDGGEGGSFQTAATAGGGGGGGGAGRVCLLRRVDLCDALTRGGAGGTGLMGGVSVLTARDGSDGADGTACEAPSPDCSGDASCLLAARPICDSTTGLCDPCASDSECVARDPSAPRCVLAGPRAGECVPCLVGDGAADCDDGNECTADTCAASLGCQNVSLPADTVCSAGFCDGAATDPLCQMCSRDEHCAGALTCNTATGTCRCTTSAQCDDGNECTADACSSGSCSNAPEPADTMCSGGFCNGAAVPPRCQECTADAHCPGALSCNTTSGTCRCTSNADCDDANDCTADVCAAGICANTSLPADTPCVGGFCDGASTDPLCRMCTLDEHCAGALSCDTSAGVCECTSDADCDDGNECTTDSCSGDVCSNAPVAADTPCSGGVCRVDTVTPRCQMCTRDEHCGGGLSCDPITGACDCTTDADCEDDNACTEDRCEAGGCARTDVEEGEACLGEAGVCAAGAPPVCVDCLEDIDCPGGRCDPETNTCDDVVADGGVPDAGVADGGGRDGGAFDASTGDAASSPRGGAVGGGGCAVTAYERDGGRAGALLFLALLGLVLARRRRRRPAPRRLATSLGVVAALLWPSAASAQTVALDRFRAGETPEDDFHVSRPDDLGHLRFGAQLYGDYALNPLVYESDLGDASSEEFRVIEHQLNLSVGLSLGLFDRLVVYAGLPVTVLNEGDDPSLATGRGLGAADGAGLGDAYLGARGRLYGEADDMFVLGAQVTMTLPTAIVDTASYRGEDHVTFHGELLGALRPGLGSRIVLNVGARFREEDPQVGTNFEMRHELTYALGFAIPVWTDDGDPNTHLDVSAQIFGSTAFAYAFEREHTGLEGNLGIKLFHGTGLVVGLAAGPGMARGIGTPDFRGILMVAYRSPPEPSSEAPVDTDGDGLLDPVDDCPTEPEDMDGFQDEDGCPDPDNDADGILDVDDRCPDEPETVNQVDDEDGCPDEVGDADGDGLLDTVDECPHEPEDMDGFEDEDGCPEVDNDGDGILDAADACPNEAGPLENRGCPDQDRDGDTVIDRLDNCPDEPGPPENQGCQEEQQVVIQQDQLRITEAVYFETARATIRERSFGLLLNVARVLNAHPEIERVVVEGHTDIRGGHDYNMRLSRDRAAAVREFLIEQGRVDAGRLESQGFGPDRPIVPDASTAAELAQNRRVEFRIPSGAAEEPGAAAAE